MLYVICYMLYVICYILYIIYYITHRIHVHHICLHSNVSIDEHIVDVQLYGNICLEQCWVSLELLYLTLPAASSQPFPPVSGGSCEWD